MIAARTVLWYLTFTGFAVNYMLRINLNITIVEMVSSEKKRHSVKNQISDGSYVAKLAPLHSNTTHYQMQRPFSLEKAFLDRFDLPYELDGFCWNEYEQGLVLGSFFWAHWITQIPGGILAKKYGTKLVFGLANAIGCWCCFFIPIFAYWNYCAVIILRVFQGLITGLAWPAMHVLTAKWIPPNERSKFVTAYLGSSVGIAVFYPTFGYVMHWTSWEYVYHMCGVLGTVWYLAWLYFVYDTPEDHPRIEDAEVCFIKKSLGSSVMHKGNQATPWLKVLTSRPVWMNVIAQFGGIWGLFTVMTQAPTYFRVIHHWNIKATGLLSGFPHLMRMLFAYAFSTLADYLLRTDRISRTNLRKLATAICCIVKGTILLGLAYYGHNAVAAIIFLTLATMVHGAVSSGPLASVVDIAPNYAGIILGISGMIGGIPGFLSSYIVGVLTLNNQTFEAWKNVFLISASMLIGSGLLYVCFSNSTLQEWNNMQGSKGAADATAEIELLKKNGEQSHENKEAEIEKSHHVA